MKHVSLYIIALMLCCSWAVNAHAQSETSPLDDLYAPYGDSGIIGTLDRPHRHQSQIGDWLEDVVSRALTISVNDIEEQEHLIRQSMDENAWAGYSHFIDTNRVRDIVRTNHVDLKSYVDNNPLLLSEGVVNGRYRWLFEVPVTMTFLQSGLKSYKNVKPVNWYIKLTVQVGRVVPDIAPDDLMLESWQVEILAEPVM